MIITVGEGVPDEYDLYGDLVLSLSAHIPNAMSYLYRLLVRLKT